MTDLITEIKKDRAEGTPDYDAGLLNDFGGGNVDWWMDYIRAEIGRANEYWRDIHEADAARIAELEARIATLTSERPYIVGWNHGFDEAMYQTEHGHPSDGDIAPKYQYTEAEYQALEARVKELEGALSPFAKAGELFRGNPGEEEFDHAIYCPVAGPEYELRGDDLRRARRALGEKSDG